MIYFCLLFWIDLGGISARDPGTFAYFRRVQVRGLSPKDFVDFLVDVLGAEGAVCGENFRFGFKAAGDAAMLKELGRILGR